MEREKRERERERERGGRKGNRRKRIFVPTAVRPQISNEKEKPVEMRFSVFHPFRSGVVGTQSRGTWNFLLASLYHLDSVPGKENRSSIKGRTQARNMGLILDLLFSFRRRASNPSSAEKKGEEKKKMYRRLGCANFFRRSKEISRKGRMSEMYKHEADPREKLKAGQTEINK